MNNKEKIVEVFRRSPLTPLTYSEIKKTADVPAGSFDRTLAALVGDGTVLKGGDGYRLGGDGTGWAVMVLPSNRRKPAPAAGC